MHRLKSRHWLLIGLVLLAPLLLAGCESSGKWGWYVVSPTTNKGRINIAFLLSGVPWTILLTICCVAMSLVFGFLLSLAGIARSKWWRGGYRAVVELFRSIPPLVSILWFYYGLPVLTGIDFGSFWSGVVALSLYGAAFMAEIFRGGVQSIGRGQFEAADSLGLSHFDKLRDVIFPQALRRSLPALGNQFVIMLKMSSLVSVIGLAEVVRRANELSVTEYRPLEIYTFLVLEYLVLVLIVSSGVRWLERRLGSDESASRSLPGQEG